MMALKNNRNKENCLLKTAGSYFCIMPGVERRRAVVTRLAVRNALLAGAYRLGIERNHDNQFDYTVT